MKKNLFILILVTGIFPVHLKGQIPFATIDSVNINRINAAVLVHGDLFWNPVTQMPACEFPAGSKKHLNYAGALWISGYDVSGKMHVSAQTYRRDGTDYWPGPLDVNDTINNRTSHDWAKIWKVNRTDIQYFQSLPTHTTDNTPAQILTWPGMGNLNAEGNDGAKLIIIKDMAPFVDLNGNGIYEPLAGEYPDIKGDQALWWVFSDNGPAHTLTNGSPLNVEIHAMAYGYNRGTLIDNVVYFEYNIINRSSNNYYNTRIGIWDDIDIGYYLDDYQGFDSTWRMAIGFNATNDDGAGAGHPANSYGMNPPQTGLTIVSMPGDVGTNYGPAGSFVIYNNDISVGLNPHSDTVCNYYMRSKLGNGQPIPSPNCCGYDSTSVIRYFYTGDPSSMGTWNECAENNNPGDRRFILSSNNFTLNAGSGEKIVFAQVVADSAGGCGSTSFNKIRIVADTAWGNYYNPPAPLPPNGVKNVAKGNLTIYPNPAQDKLSIENTGKVTGNESVTIYNTLGQVVNVPLIKTGNKSELNISKLPAGLYNVLYRTDEMQTRRKFIKE